MSETPIRPIDIYNARKVLKLTQKEFGELSGVSCEAVRLWENCKNAIRESNIAKIMPIINEARSYCKDGVFPNDTPDQADYDAMLAYKEQRKASHASEMVQREQTVTCDDREAALHRFLQDLEFMLDACADGLVDPKFLKMWYDHYKVK